MSDREGRARAVVRHYWIRELLRFSASPFTFTDSLKLLIAPLHLKDTPDVAPQLLLLFCVPDVRHLNGHLRASVKSGARGPLVFRVRLRARADLEEGGRSNPTSCHRSLVSISSMVIRTSHGHGRRWLRGRVGKFAENRRPHANKRCARVGLHSERDACATCRICHARRRDETRNRTL